MVPMDEICDAEWVEWYLLEPCERWQRTLELWTDFLILGGSLDPEPDSQSPFYDAEAPSQSPSYGRPGLRVVRRGGV